MGYWFTPVPDAMLPRVIRCQMSIQEDATSVLKYLAERPERGALMNQALADGTQIPADRLNDAVSILEGSGYVETLRTMGNRPFDFLRVSITPRGRAEWERAAAAATAAPFEAPAVRPTPQPVGSPFGFTDLDWEWIASERQKRTLKVVLGYQFESTHYETSSLVSVVRQVFETALTDSEFKEALTLDFVPLRAGYGEHVFNEIARTIISADVSVFETSDRNPNVMIEMGVALTWGTRVHPIREASTAPPPSDISGQTWATYRDSGRIWTDGNHHESLVQMINRAARKKMAEQ